MLFSFSHFVISYKIYFTMQSPQLDLTPIFKNYTKQQKCQHLSHLLDEH